LGSVQRLIKTYLIDFGYMVMNLNRKQLSFLITFFSMSIVILSLYNIHLGKKERMDEYVVEMLLQDDVEELEKQKEELEEAQKKDPVESHMAYNEAMDASQGNPEDFKTLEELMEEREAAEEENDDPSDFTDADYSDRIREFKKRRQQVERRLGEKDAKKQEYTNNLAKRRTSVSFSLIDRTGYRLPPPIYTCIEGGKIVVNIEVNGSGTVIDADYNSNSSNTSNGCLVENAIAYAYKARFSSHARASQKGTITYIFQGK